MRANPPYSRQGTSRIFSGPPLRICTSRSPPGVEIVGTSPDGVDAAIRNVSRASQTFRGLDCFEVQSVRGELEQDRVAHFQVTLKVGLRLE
jgi:dodecin